LGWVGSSSKIFKKIVYNTGIIVTNIRSSLSATKVEAVELVQWGCEMG